MKTTIRAVITSLVMIPLLAIATTAPTAAHVLKENNGISGVLHIDPDDNPLAGQNTVLEMSFGDPNDSFNLVHCNCQVRVTANNKTIQTVVLRPATATSTLAGKATVRFPAIGVYDVIVSGTATDGSFPSFSLDYLERVAGSATTPRPTGAGEQVLLISAGALVILGVVAFTNIERSQRYKRSPPPKPPSAVKGVKK